MKDLINKLNTTSLEACFDGLQRAGTPLALATVVQAVSPTSGKPGDKALVTGEAIVEGWIGGGCAQPAVIEATRGALESGESSLIRVGPKGEWEPLEGIVDYTSGCLSGGTLVIFIEPMIKRPLLNILGNSPAAHSLCYLAGHLGFAVTLTCPDPVAGNLPENVRRATDFSKVDGDFIVIATQGKHDLSALKAALATSAPHIAMIASSRKIAGLKASLARSGVDTIQLDRIHSPAGIEIGARTPAEIALSVLAEMVRARRGEKNAPQAAMVSPQAVATEEGGGCCGG
ncbi:MAG: XdhC family protein [Gammaproteobacteria bacterium]|nr:XdhC family protein [Gammaproteobacteria bacterium]MDH3450112.1 XdhC family protein [Gammaproteobacteria bacterium]